MPHSTRAKSRAVQNLLPNPEQQAWWFVKHLLRTSLQDTRSLLLTWTQTRQTETLHQARVAWRRQKSLLKFYRPLLPEPPHRHNDVLQTLWHLTGQLRNLDVALECTLPAWRQAHPDAGTHRQCFLVRGVESKEAQHAGVGTIVQRHQQLAARTERHLGRRDGALNLQRIALARRAQPVDAGFVLVAQRQVQRQVNGAHQPELAQGLLRQAQGE